MVFTNTFNSPMKVSLGTQKIQKGRRIVMGESALENLRLNVGDTVKVYLDTELMCLLIEPQQQKTAASKLKIEGAP